MIKVKQPCFVCKNAEAYQHGPPDPQNPMYCPRCGNFVVALTAYSEFHARLKDASDYRRAIVSHRVRSSQTPSVEFVTITLEKLPAFLEGELPKPEEQLDKLVIAIGDAQQTPEDYAIFSRERLAATIGTGLRLDVTNEPGLKWLLAEAVPYQMFKNNPDISFGRLSMRLTMKGWERYDQLLRQKVDSRNAFMAMKFNEPVLNHVLENCFKPAVKRAGFGLRPLNEAQPAGLIDNQMRTAIRTAKFVIADLTHDNNGAYFEAGFAEGLGIPVFYTCEHEKFQKKKTHFDTNHMVTVVWSETNLAEAEEKLVATIRVTLPSDAIMAD